MSLSEKNEETPKRRQPKYSCLGPLHFGLITAEVFSKKGHKTLFFKTVHLDLELETS